MSDISQALIKHSAKGPAAAHLFQLERVVRWLAERPSSLKVGLEIGEDVTVVTDKDAFILEEDKHSTSTYQPFRDAGEDLWKSLANWADAIDESFTADSVQFFLTTNKSVNSGLAFEIDKAKTDSEYKDLIRKIRKAASSSTTRPYMSRVRKLKDEQMTELLKSIRLLQLAPGTSASGDRSSLYKLLRIEEDETGEEIANSLIGWVEREIMKQWQEGKSAWILTKHFNERLRSLIVKNDKLSITVRLKKGLPPITKGEIDLHRTKPFISQLQLIYDGSKRAENIYLDAIENFIRTKTERSRLARLGRLEEEDFSRFDESLEDAWKLIFGHESANVTRYSCDEECGREIFKQTLSIKELLANQSTPPYFVQGSYHGLANEKIVGWHPEFRELI